MKKVTSKRVIITSMLVNVLDIGLNLTIAIFTGSAVMVSEALQGAADMSAVTLLYIGHSRAEKPATRRHPFGHGKEIYFWALLAGFIIFAITSSLSFFFGYRNFIDPEPIEHIAFAFAALSIGAITNGYSLSLGIRRILHKQRFTKLGWIFFTTPLIEPKTTLILDMMGTLAALIGLSSLLTAQFTGDWRLDGLGAMAIAVMLAVLAALLLIGIRDLVIGKTAPPHIKGLITREVEKVKGVIDVLELNTMVIGTNKFLAIVEVHVKGELHTREIEKLTDKIKESVQKKIPSIKHIQVEIETPD